MTSATRMWLTRSVKPFTFRDDYDKELHFTHLDGLGLYVHIPFCKRICPFCPYCKQVYDNALSNRYLDALIEEIHMVGAQCREKKRVTSLYFGGGTPALIARRLHEVVAAVEEHFVVTEGIGVELHPENVTEETLRTLKAAGVTKVSVGVQSFGGKFLSMLGRGADDFEEMFRALKAVPFETVSMDFIFALPGQTVEDLKADIERAFSNGANHIAMYPFIDFSFTESTVVPMGKREKRALLDGITAYCEAKGYRRNSIWTYSNGGEARYSSMTRTHYLGFGCSAATLLGEQFKINTFSVEAYLERIAGGELPTALTIRFTPRQRMVYYLFWTAYSTSVAAADFEAMFGAPLKQKYGMELFWAKRLGFITQRGDVYEMTAKGAFYYHYYEGYYTLAYIDKMWNVMRKEPFPKELKF